MQVKTKPVQVSHKKASFHQKIRARRTHSGRVPATPGVSTIN